MTSQTNTAVLRAAALQVRDARRAALAKGETLSPAALQATFKTAVGQIEQDRDRASARSKAR